MNVLGGFLAAPGDLFFLMLNDGTDPVNGQFADGNAITIGSQNFLISYTANSASVNFGGGNDIALQVVPEPATVTLLALSSLTLARRRRQPRH